MPQNGRGSTQDRRPFSRGRHAPDQAVGESKGHDPLLAPRWPFHLARIRTREVHGASPCSEGTVFAMLDPFSVAVTHSRNCMAVRLLAAGDICPGDHYFSLGHGTGSRLAKGENPFEDIASLLREGDLRIANLEGPLSSFSSHSGGPEAVAFRGPPNAAALLRGAGIDLLHVANNHVLQHGADAFRMGISLIEDQGIAPVGLLGEQGAVPVLMTVEGLALGFLGYSFVPERYLPGQRLYAAPVLKAVIQDVEELRERVDLVVVSVHWGQEGTGFPVQDVVEAGHAIVAAGATLVLGHHPHWFQPVERVGRALIAYSLGDLLFDLFWDRRLVESAILSVDLDEGGIIQHRLIPIQLDRDYRLRPQPRRAARRFLAELEGKGRVLSEVREDHPTPRPPRLEALRKLAYFLRQFHRGDTLQKARYVAGKIAGSARRSLPGTQGGGL